MPPPRNRPDHAAHVADNPRQKVQLMLSRPAEPEVLGSDPQPPACHPSRAGQAPFGIITQRKPRLH